VRPSGGRGGGHGRRGSVPAPTRLGQAVTRLTSLGRTEEAKPLTLLVSQLRDKKENGAAR
jgi:hypothetical protein